MNKLIPLLLLLPLIIIPLSLASNTQSSTTHVTYTIVYTKTATLHAVHNTTEVKGSLLENSVLNVNVASTTLSNGKFNDTIKVTGYTYHEIKLNVSGMLFSSLHNSTVNEMISFVSNYSIQNVTNLLSLLNILNLTFSKSGNVTYYNITTLYSVKFYKVGTTTVQINGQNYTGYLYSLNVSKKTTSNSNLQLYSTSNLVGNAILLSNGLLYNASLSGSGDLSLSIMRFNLVGNSNENIVIKLISTNALNSVSTSAMSPSQSTTTSTNEENNVQPKTTNPVSLTEVLVPAGIIASLTALVLLVRKLI